MRNEVKSLNPHPSSLILQKGCFMWEYYHVFLPGKIQTPKGIAGFDPVVGVGPNGLAAEHNNYTNQLGAQGWELVSCSPVSVTDGITIGLYLVFKRRK
jgi:hypothetical protein